MGELDGGRPWGELRGDGSYVAAPPSEHVTYRTLAERNTSRHDIESWIAHYYERMLLP